MKELKKKYETVLTRELFESCAPFWLRYGRDPIYGGVANCLDREGRLYSTDKSVWMQGRTAYTYSYLYNTFEKKPEWLAFAADCLGFLKAHCFDEDGRMFFTVTQDGRPLRKRRYWFSDTYADIAKQVGLTEKNVSVRLTRLRKDLREYLIEREVLL